MKRILLALLLLQASPLAAQAPLPWTIGSRVHANNLVYARTDTLGLGPNVLRVAGDKGTILGGPAGGSTVWGVSWLVYYDTPPNGWSTQVYLTLDTLSIPKVAPTLTIVPSGIGMQVGNSTQLYTVATDSFGRVIWPLAVQWGTGKRTVVLVGIGGVVQGIGRGTDTVFASVGTQTAIALVSVF